MRTSVQIKSSILLAVLFYFCACKSHEPEPVDETTETITPVKVTTISRAPMSEIIELNATSSFLQKWSVKANVTGYIQSSNARLNEPVGNGEILYKVRTKEAESIGNTINDLDSSFRFSGANTIRAMASGFISEVVHQAGDYVLDGETLAVITDTKSFVFLLDLPYELRPFIRQKQSLELYLPDGEKLTGSVSGVMNIMDSVSQTQRFILKVPHRNAMPENLIAKVRIPKSSKGNAQCLPRSAILTNETQDQFWVMKLSDSVTAIKVPVEKGLESNALVEILSPLFSPQDQILVSGNYGLPDTARVRIIQ